MGGKSAKRVDYGPLAEAQKEAARIQAAAYDRGIKAQQEQYEQTRRDFKPWRRIGLWALDEIETRMRYDPGHEGSFQNEDWQGFGKEEFERSPGYDFRKREGRKSIRRSLNARGYGAGGGTMQKELLRYNQGLASNEFGAARARAVEDYSIRQHQRSLSYNRLAGLAGTGQAATGSVATIGAGTANQVSQLHAASGGAMAQGTLGAAQTMIAEQQYNNQVSQQKFSNMLGILGLGLGAWSVFKGPGGK